MVASFAILAGGIAILCAITPETPGLAIGLLLMIAGFGIGLSFEILVLIVQNEFSASEGGMSTAATNLVREMGTTLGAAITGALFSIRLADTLASNLASSGGLAALGVDANALTPAIARNLPDAVQAAVRLAYHDALVPIFVLMALLGVIGFLLMLLLREKPLSDKQDQ